MIPVAVVVPEERLRSSLAPVMREAGIRGIPVFLPHMTWTADIKAAIGLDGFVPKAIYRIAVDNWFDAWRHAPDPRQIMCYSTRYHRDTHAALWPGAPQPESEIVGCLWADGRPLLTDRPYAVFFTPKMVAERQTRAFVAYYKAALRMTIAAAKREGLTLIVKTRRKHKDPWWIQWNHGAYGVCSDETSSLELLRRAQWCVHFGSGAALEAAALGAFSYWFPAPEAYLADSPGTDRRPAMFCYPGVSRMGAPCGATLDPLARARFLDTYVGSLDGKAAARVLDLAEGL